MKTDTLTLGILTLVAKQDGPYLRANVSGEGGFLGQLHFTVAEWTSLRALVDVLSAADKRHAEDRAAIDVLKQECRELEQRRDVYREAARLYDQLGEELEQIVGGDGTSLERLRALETERNTYRDALTKISAIRDSIVGMQGFNFSEHAYPLVAALDEAGFKGAGYEIARKNLGTLIEQRDKAERERDTAVAQLGGYRVLFDEQGRALTKARQEVATMCPVYEAALQWRRELIGERTSYDLRLEAAVDEAAEQAKAKEAKAESNG